MNRSLPWLATLLCAAALGGCAGQGGSQDAAFGWWGDDDGGWNGRPGHARGGRSEPGNEAGMYPARASDGRGGGQGSGGRGGEAGM